MGVFLDESYVVPLKSKGYIEVDKMDISNGIYYLTGGGYQMNIHERLDKKNKGVDYTGYSVITTSGIRGSYNHEVDTIEVRDGFPIIGARDGGNLAENVYKIMSCVLSDIRDDKIVKIVN